MKKFAKNSTMNIFENKPYYLIEHFIAVILIPNIVKKNFEIFAIKKKWKCASDIKKKKNCGSANSHVTGVSE